MFAAIRAWFQDKYEDYRWGQYFKHSAWAAERQAPVAGLRQWDDSIPAEQQDYIYPVRIVVPSEENKQQILLALKYIHDLRELDTGYIAVNALVHMYTDPTSIIVQPELADERLAATA